MTDGKAAAAPLELPGPPGRSRLLIRVEAAIARARTQGLAVVLLVLIAFFAMSAPGFANWNNLNDTLRDLSILGILAIGEIFVVMLIVGTLVLRRTRFGIYLYAVGGSELAARLTRINVRQVQLSTYVIGGFCSAIAGVILASRLQTGAPEAGLGEEFDVIAAV